VIGIVRPSRFHRRRPRAANDAGLSLVELMVAMFVTSILLAGISTVFVGTLRGVKTVNVKTSTGLDVGLAIEAMSRTVKVASLPYGETTAMVTASTTGMSFYALLNRTGSVSTTEPIPSLMEYSYAANCLTEAVTPGLLIASPSVGGPYYSWPAASKKSKCLLRTTTSPTFSYYASGDLTATALSAGSGLSAADLDNVRSVGLHLVATDPANAAIVGVPADTRISLENLIAGDGS
jgi:prepilin-type N-terminal cleavage/methylation domain-containing protein